MKPHFAVISSPGLGHLIPLFELAKRLVVDHGCHISFLVITTNQPSAVQDQYLESSSFPPGLDLVNMPLVNVDDITADPGSIVARLCLIVEKSIESLASVLCNLDKPVNALIIDLFCTPAFDVCEKLSIPVYSFVTTSTTILAFCLYLPMLDQDVEGEFTDLPEPIQIPGCSAVRPTDIMQPAKNRKVDEYKWTLLSLRRLPLAAGLILNSWEDLEPIPLKALRENPFFTRIPTPSLFLAGPMIKSNDQLDSIAKSDQCLAWLEKQPVESVLLVSLGSGGTLSTEQLHELAWGLELSKQRFILVVRAPKDGISCGAFFNVGNDVKHDPTWILPQGFLERIRGVGMVVTEWAPQVCILRHASTGGFLSHCGWNSSLESIVHGVPMIAWPLYAEQAMNAATLEEDIKVAVRLPIEGNKVVRREEIEKVVRFLMESEEGNVLRERAKDLRESALNALDTQGPSFQSIACLVNGLEEMANI